MRTLSGKLIEQCGEPESLSESLNEELGYGWSGRVIVLRTEASLLIHSW
jgi:hypothetical protein